MERYPTQPTLAASTAHDREPKGDALDWPPLSEEHIRWLIVAGGAVVAALLGVLLGGAMSL